MPFYFTTGEIMRYLLLLLSITLMFAQDDPHVYWEFNTEFVEDMDAFEDENIAYWVNDSSDRGDTCVENTDDGYYICLARVSADVCASNSDDDIAIIKISYDGEEIDRDYICDFNDDSYHANDYPYAIAYGNGNLYVIANIGVDINHPLYQDLYENSSGSYNRLMKVSLENFGEIEWIRLLMRCGADNADNCNSVYARDLKVDAEGNAIIFGQVYRQWYNDENATGTYISKYGADGNPIWFSFNKIPNEAISLDCDINFSDQPRDSFIDINNNNLFIIGYSACNNIYFSFLAKVDLNTGNLLWIKDLNQLGIAIDYSQINTVLGLSNGNIFVGGKSDSYIAMGLLDSDGIFLNYSLVVECYNDPFHICTGNIEDSIETADGNIALTGNANFTNLSWLGSQALIMSVDSSTLDVIEVNNFGTPIVSYSDYFNQILRSSNGSLLLAGEFGDGQGWVGERAVLLNVAYKSGCTNSSSCNYDEYADYDNGSCWQTIDSCTCADDEGSIDDVCGECNGNGYDTCDNDNDGTSNYDQWGYGAYNLSLTDIPNDYGGGLYLTFNKSFYDQDDASRNEFYTVERLDEAGWVSLNSISAYNQATYTTEVSTQFDGSETEFRVVSSMDEGTFISTQSGLGTSVDNLTILGCMDINACNYYSQATLDNGTCTYAQGTCDCNENPNEGYCGCNDETIDGCGECTLNPTDTDMDGIPDSCDPCPLDGDNDADNDTVCDDIDICPGEDDLLDTDGDDVVDCQEIDGCMDNVACNFSDTATDDDGTCFYGYVFCIDLDDDGFGDPAYTYTSCDDPDPNPLYIENCEDTDDDCASNVHDCDNVCDGEAYESLLCDCVGGDTGLEPDYCYNPGDINFDATINVVDIVAGVNNLLSGDDLTDEMNLLGDYNLDGVADVLDLALIVDDIMGSIRIPATSVDLMFTDSEISYSADGYVSFHITLAHGPGFALELTDDMFVALYETYEDSMTEIIIIEPNSSPLIELNGDFMITDAIAVSDDYIDVTIGALGCMEEDAYNYNADAIFDSQDCIHPAPEILGISDIDNDQGRNVYISFTASVLDDEDEDRDIEMYNVERWDPDPISEGLDSMWVNITSGSAYAQESYTFQVSTLLDSNATTDGLTAFRVIANLDEGLWISESAFGYSVDNIHPPVPGSFSGGYNGEIISLSWEEMYEEDFSHFQIVRNDLLIHESSDIGFTDNSLIDEVELTYQLSAVDLNGNIGDANEIIVLQTLTSIGDVNKDGMNNIFDIIILVDIILGNYNGNNGTPDFQVIWASDLNNDGSINVVDIVQLVNIILDIL